jgi:hypothetical protein
LIGRANTLYLSKQLKLKRMKLQFTKRELQQLDTIEQAWDGDELKIEDDGVKVWLVLPQNRQYNGDYVVENRINGVWYQTSCHFEMA